MEEITVLLQNNRETSYRNRHKLTCYLTGTLLRVFLILLLITIQGNMMFVENSVVGRERTRTRYEGELS